MNALSLLAALALMVASGLHPQAAALPSPGFAKSYPAPPGYAGWHGQIERVPNATSYWLSASSLIASTGERVLAAAGLRSDGTVDWALSSTQGLRGVMSFRPLPAQGSVLAKLEGLPGEDFWTVFGVFDAHDGRRIFERGIPVIVDQVGASYVPDPVPTVEWFTDGRSLVVLKGAGNEVHLAMLDAKGVPQWQKALRSASFENNPTQFQVIENPGNGFWLLMQTSRTISPDPNPPPVNTAITLNLLRFSDSGEVLGTTKLAGLLASSPVLTGGPVAIDSDGTVVLTLTDTVINTWGTPTLLDVVTYLLAIGPDGSLRWGRRISGMTLATPLLVQGSGTVYLVGQKLISPTATVADSVILRLAAATGNLIARTSVKASSALFLKPAGLTKDQLFFQATAPGTSKALIGSMNRALQATAWKQFDAYPPSQALLSFEPKTSTLLFSATSAASSKIDAMTLDANLNLLAPADPQTVPCPLFSDVSVALVDPDVRLEPLVLTPSFLAVSVNDTDLPLIPSTRIALGAIGIEQNDQCPPTDSNQARLAVHADPTQETLTVSFLSEAGHTYELLFTTGLEQPFKALETVVGDGGPIARVVRLPKDQNGFFSVRVAAP